jgi:hypothetical protein
LSESAQGEAKQFPDTESLIGREKTAVSDPVRYSAAR